MEFPNAVLPTEFGQFTIYSFSNDVISLIKGNVKKELDLLVRVHSECLTGDVLGSLRCDCRAQLEKSIDLISKEKNGLLIYIRSHEGRGIGLMNKIKAYELQDNGSDTMEANHQLGFVSDKRTYNMVKEVLSYFQITSIRLLTNNPDKVIQLEQNGIKISEVIPLKTEPTEYNKNYLETKKEKMGHLL